MKVLTFLTMPADASSANLHRQVEIMQRAKVGCSMRALSMQSEHRWGCTSVAAGGRHALCQREDKDQH